MVLPYVDMKKCDRLSRPCVKRINGQCTPEDVAECIKKGVFNNE